MPDPAPSNKRPPLDCLPVSCAPLGPNYAELHCKTNFSFLEGASHPDELVFRAVELGYAALAVTDRNSLAGVVRAHVAAKQAGLRLLIGAEITPVDAPGVILWAPDRAAYGRLSRLITVGRRQAPKGECHLTFADVAAYGDGLLAGVLPERKAEGGRRKAESKPPLPPEEGEGEGNKVSHKTLGATGCLSASAPPSAFRLPPSLRVLSSDDTLSHLHRYREMFGDRCYLIAELCRGPDDERYLEQLIDLSHRSRLPLVAAGDVRYHRRSRLALADVLAATSLGLTVAEAAGHLFPNAERYLKSREEMGARFTRVPAAIERTLEIAQRCSFSLEELRYEYPEELAPAGTTPLEYLIRLTWSGARQRYPQGVPAKVRELVEHELQLIAELRHEAYFLTVFDLVRFARRRGILCQGRGSAANSAVCYCLGVTAVDPDRMDLLFERFISRERNEAPDIDIDFEHERREEVLQYLYDKYGRDRAGMTAEVITYRPRSAVRDVGKALGLSLGQVDALAKSLEGHHVVTNLDDRCRDAAVDPDSLIGQRLIGLVGELVGFPRHLGQHVGGMVMTHGPLSELVPIENAAMDERTVIQWDKNDLDELGILKVDCLSLGMLTAIRKCFDLVERHHGRRLTLASVPADDSQVYDMICRADTMGVFQIESRAQMSMLPRLRPRSFYDLVIEVAIVRPGPIQGKMVHPYLRRRAGDEPVTFPNEEIRDVLKKTMGVPLFQEQAMRLAVVAAGFTPGEADQLRRAMGAWRRPGVIDEFRKKLIDGMLARGLCEQFAQQVFEQIRGFGEYGFPESHAASFALLVYVSAWLKHYYPAEFAAALLNSQPMGFYAPAQLVRNAREHGVEVRAVDVNHSQWDCTLEGGSIRNSEFGIRKGRSKLLVADNTTDDHRLGGLLAARACPQPLAVRLGLRMISGLPETHARAIERARRQGPFRSLDEFARRTGLSRAVLMRLSGADALSSMGLDRRGALWQALSQEKQTRPMPLLDHLEPDEPAAELPHMPPQAEVVADYRTVGLSLKAHPLEFERRELDKLGIAKAVDLATLPNNRHVRVAGLVLVRQRPGTARGITFVTLEDETGTANLIIRQDVWQRYYLPARTAAALVAHGRLQRHDEVIHVLVSKLEDLTERLRGLRSQSRDFQ